MVNTFDYIIKRFNLSKRSAYIGIPNVYIGIPNAGRDDLARVFNELGFKEGAEIGTEKGKYAWVLGNSIPGIKLHCIDPYLFYENGEGYRNTVSSGYFEKIKQEARERLLPYNFDRDELVDIYFTYELSSDAVKKFPHNSLDFVYIDGNHRLDYVVEDLVNWTYRVKPGGIVAGHDFIKHARQVYSHVPYALEAYRQAYNIDHVFILDQKSDDKSEELNKKMDRIRSWFFVKK